MRISDWSSDVCSSDLLAPDVEAVPGHGRVGDLQKRPQDQHPEQEHESEAEQHARRRKPPPGGLPQTGDSHCRTRIRKIGRASWRERECTYGEISVGPGEL